MAVDTSNAGDSSVWVQPGTSHWTSVCDLGNEGKADLRRGPGAEPEERTDRSPPTRREEVPSHTWRVWTWRQCPPQKEFLPGRHWLLKEEGQNQQRPLRTLIPCCSLGSRAMVYASRVAWKSSRWKCKCRWCRVQGALVHADGRCRPSAGTRTLSTRAWEDSQPRFAGTVERNPGKKATVSRSAEMGLQRRQVWESSASRERHVFIVWPRRLTHVEFSLLLALSSAHSLIQCVWTQCRVYPSSTRWSGFENMTTLK